MDLLYTYIRTVLLTKMYYSTSFALLQNPIGVTLGGTLGHAICTTLAVIGGKMVAQRISVKTGMLI